MRRTVFDMLDTLDEIYKLVVDNKYYEIDKKLFLKNGIKLGNVWNNILNKQFDPTNDERINKLLGEKIYAISCELAKNLPVNNFESSIDYQKDFMNLAVMFNLNAVTVFENFKVPNGYYNDVINGKVYPSPNISMNIMNGLEKLKVTNEQQRIVRDEALKDLKKLYSEAILRRTPNFKLEILGSDDLIDALKHFDLCSFEELDEIYKTNKVWYKKFVLFVYAYLNDAVSDIYNFYFDDGKFGFKWYSTQLRTIEGKVEVREFTKLQEKLILKLQEAHEIKRGGNVKQRLTTDFINNFDEYAEFIKDCSKYKMVEVSTKKFKGRTYEEIKSLFKELLNDRNCPIYSKLVKLQSEVFDIKYANNRENKRSNNFSYNFNKLYISLNMTVQEFAEWMNLDVNTVKSYLYAIVYPSSNTINSMIITLKGHFNDNLSREQFTIIKDFIEIIKELDIERSKRRSELASERRQKYSNTDLVFKQKMDMLKEFFDANNRVPEKEEISFLNCDGAYFYMTTRQIAQRNYRYPDISDEVLYELTDLLNYISIKSNNDIEDNSMDGKYYIGNTLNRLRCALGVTSKALFKHLKIYDRNCTRYIHNDAFFIKKDIISFIDLLSKTNMDCLREYQKLVLKDTIDSLNKALDVSTKKI